FLPGGDGLADLPLDEKVARCVEIKARVVGADEREGGLRAILNYGHTLAHALEAATGYHALRHGEAVGIGLVYAAELAHGLGRIDEERVKEHRAVVEGYGLPTAIPAGLDVEHVQSNAEAELVDAVQGARHRCAAIIINAAALSHYSWSLHDALATFDGVVVELHLSNPLAREPWRHTSTISSAATGIIAGFRGHGYKLAVEAVARLLEDGS